MLKKLLLLLIITSPVIFADVLDSEGRPSNDLVNLLEVVGINHDGTLKNIVEETQKTFRRKGLAERWEIEANVSLELEREKILGLLTNMGFIREISPSKSFYKYAVVLGALMSRVKDRYNYLIKLWEKGVRFEEVVFLTGQRALQPSEIEAISGAEMETDMVKHVVAVTQAPEEMLKLKYTYVDTEPAPGKLRPNTLDTVAAWNNQLLAQAPADALAVSNQPYIPYQDSILKALLPTWLTVETVGPTCYNDLSVSLHLDNLAGYLYSEYMKRSINGTN